MSKKYYWLKLRDDFFTQPRIKKLRRIAGGDTFTIIYLKLQLLSLKNGGELFFENIEDDIIEELALQIDEEVDNVKVTFNFLINQGLVELIDDKVEMIETKGLIGKETDSAERVRKHRNRLKEQKALHCNTLVTICNTEIELDIDKDIDKELKNSTKKRVNKFTPPTLEEVSAYCLERKNNINPQYFIDYQQAREWVLSNGKKMKDWKATIRYWEQNSFSKPQSKVVEIPTYYNQTDDESEKQEALRKLREME